VAVTLIRRPIGHKLSETQLEGTIYDNGAGDAVVYVAGGHSLSDGDYVYVESDFDSYNGYKYVDAVSYDYFKIKNSEEGDPILWVQDAEVTMYVSALNHGYQCVHLPIVYELESDLYPNNIAEEEYTPNVIDSFEDFNGSVQLNLDTAITGLQELNYIELVGDGPLAGPYQITSVVQPWAIVINLAYDAGLSFTGYQVVNYYNNYNINVEVWAGLDASHRWNSVKPFELATTLKFIPDSNGKILFSIHEILKGYIETNNNLTLDTLPNNTDFHVSFYIKYYESYDLSDGDTISVNEGEVTTDTFEGVAVNAMLPFKSLNSGHLSEYLSSGDILARWLTLFDRPIAVVGYFFDLSFINQYSGINLLVLVNGELDQTITNPGSGVIRVPFEFEASGEHCVQVFGDGSIQNYSLAGFTNRSGTGSSWTLGASPSVSLVAQTSLYLVGEYSFISGTEYTISIDLTQSGLGTFIIAVLDEDDNILESDSFIVAGNSTESYTFTAATESAKIGFRMSGTTDISLSNLDISITTFAITERICIDVIEECGETFNNEFRITDGEDLRRV
jgi:hypothetical protein